MATQRILAATDGSEMANRALDLAVEISVALHCDLSIVHVLMHGRPAEEIKRMADIERLVAAAPAGLALASPAVPASVAELIAAAEAESRGLRLIEIIGETTLRDAADRAMARGATNLRTHLADGDYADEILDAAETDGARMIVLGSRGLGRLRAAVLGSVSQKVAHHATCAVLLAK
ncbi:universal stress protein [Oceaniglobus roseus]|uniref:universal stress protein n=1 Tax=Oceaniglobus roseus TaxID=1737570 RepID=UPI0012FFE1F1|nr:universal stress protein [Kandeliimicrobium roseum]